MDRFKFNQFVPFTKVDDEKRMIYGWASTPDIDSDGEVIELEAMSKALPAYMKYPTIREMHQPRAAGTTKSAEVVNDKKQKGVYIGAKIVSDEAWKLVKEGVYKGLSIGGNVVRRVGNIIKEIELVEISLVDVPANKKASIELWKVTDLNKDANSTYSMAELMMRVKYQIDAMRYKKKDTKKLENILEMVKDLVAVEAKESEPAPRQDTVFYADNAEDLQKRIQLLKNMKFDNPAAEVLRKGVILAMDEQEKELKKGEGEKDQKTEEQKDIVAEESDKTPAKAKEDESFDDFEDDDSSEKSDEGTLEKVTQISEKLDKVTKKEKKEDVVKKESLEKTVKALTSVVSKMVDTMAALNERLEKVESTPAATKSKATTVFKSEADKEDKKVDEPADKENAEVTKRKKRLDELNDLYSKMTPNSFAKAGYSMEAMRITKELEELQRGQ